MYHGNSMFLKKYIYISIKTLHYPDVWLTLMPTYKYISVPIVN